MSNEAQVVQKGRSGSPAESTRGSQYFVPPVDIYETDTELLLYADVPGISCQDVNLRFEKGELILEGHLPARERKGSPLHSEYEEGDFYRVFQVHESIDGSRIEAECKNGVLTIHLPKEERARPHKVTVKGS